MPEPVPVAAALRQAASQLSRVSDTPRLDAELLMAHALEVERDQLLLDPGRFAVPADFAALIERRRAHEPIAYILGYRDFWTVQIGVGPGVLIPRADSEALLDAACRHFGATPPKQILDLGTGPGTLLLAALAQWPSAAGVGVDASPVALDWARGNADRLGFADRAAWQAGDWAAGVRGSFDLILCNPPYIAVHEELMPDVADYEPAEALFAGADGLDDYRRILPQLASLLATGGLAALEIGWTQADAVTALARAEGWAAKVHQDLAGRDRVVALTHAPHHQ
jgi:release factor glutamine methyltransferase